MRDFENIKKIIVKIGTNTLSKQNSIEIDINYIKNIAKQIVDLKKKGIQTVIVTSGAIGMGAGKLNLNQVTEPKTRQACAAVGQPLLMDAYRVAFSKYKVKIAQVLLTSDVLDKITTYRNLRNALDELLSLGIVPVVNENDSVSTEEIDMTFGDNDKLSARIASKIEADLLVLLSDIDALYTHDPKKNKNAKLIPHVDKIDNKILLAAGHAGSKYAKGGMKSKIEAVKIAFDAGCKIVLAGGRKENILINILNGDYIGTFFDPETVRKFNEHERWIKNSRANGNISLNGGVIWKKIKKQQDIVPRDINNITGVFDKGTVITINKKFKAIAQINSDMIKRLKGKTKSEIKKTLGKGQGDTIVAKHDDIVPIDDI